VGRLQILGSEGSSLAQRPRAGRMLLCLLYLFTAVTRLVDAVSYIGLGHVFTANMTGNVVFLGFGFAGTPGLSVPRSLASETKWFFLSSRFLSL